MLVTTIFNFLISFLTSVYFICLLAFVLVIFASGYIYFTRNFGKLEKKFGVKGLKPVPFFGTEKDFMFQTKNHNDLVVDRYKEFDGEKFGIIYQGARPSLFVRDVELLKNICIKDFDHFMDFFADGLDSIVDSNLFFMKGDKWKNSKGALSQVFRVKNVKDILPKLNSCVKKSMLQMDSFAKTGEDLSIDDKIIEPCLLDCVGHAVLGVRFDEASDASSEFVKMVNLLQSSIWRFVLLTICPEVMVLFGIKVFYPKATVYLDKILRQLVDDHTKNRRFDDMMGVHLKVKEEVEKKKAENISTGEELLPLTNEMIISSCMQFFFDGVVTIASMLDIAIFFLAKHPEIQEKAFEEIQNVMGSRLTSEDGSDDLNDLPDITDNDLMEMKYIEQIFSEASRMAAFPFIARSCTKDYQIPGTSFVVPKGTPVFIPILGFHMDPKLFPNPEKFDPERFSAENKGNILTGSFIPFGLGPRMCLGKNFIRMEGRCFLANMVRSFRILPSDKTIKNLEWEVESQGKVKGGLFVKLERREN